MSSFKIIFSIVILTISSVAYAENTIALDFNNLEAAIPIDQNIRKGVLENGLTYYIKKNAKPEKRMELRLVVKAGAINEDADQNGIAHFVEHMLFNGTEHFPKNDLVHYLEKVGVRFGADLNAYTSEDRTVYQLPIPTDKAELINNSFKILADWAGHATFKSEDIDKERGVVLEEWRLNQGARMRASKVHRPIVYYGSKLAHHDVIGDAQIIEKAPYSVIKRFYQDWYRPDLMAVIAVGDFDIEMIEKQIKANFSTLKNPPQERQLTGNDIEVKANKEPLISIHTDSEHTATVAKVVFKKTAEKQGLLGAYRHNFMHTIAASMLNERVNELLQKKDPPFQKATISYSNLLLNTDTFNIYSILKTEDFITSYRAALTEVFRSIQQGFFESEYQRAKVKLLTAIEKQYNNRDKIESGQFADEYIRNFMDNEPIPNIADDYAIYKNFADTISISDINQLIKNYITDDNMFIYASAVEKNGITPPTQEQLLANYQKLKNSTFDEYQDKFSDKALFSKEVNAGTIVKTTEIKAVGITEFVLSNGIKVLVKPTGFNDSEVLFHAFSKGGMSLVPIKEYLNGKYAAQIIAASGIADFNMPILQKLLTGKYVKISPYINDVSEGFSGNSFTKDVETLLQLLNLYFTQPHKDQESFQSFVTRTKQWVDNSKRHPSTEFIEAISYIMSGNDPHNQPITKEMIESLDLDKSYQIYQERFADPSDFTFVFVGNIDLEKFKPFLTQYLASLPTKGSKENFKDIFNDKPKQAIKKDFYKGKEDKSTLVLKLNGAADYNLKNIYIASALEKILNYRLIDKLREEKSEVYSPSASLSISHYPKPEYNLTIQLGCKPSNVASLIKTVKGILQELQTQLPSDEDMQKIKEADKRQYETNLKENSYWMSKIIQAYHHGLDVQQILHYPELIASLSKEDIRKAAQEYFKLHSLKEFVLYPEKK